MNVDQFQIPFNNYARLSPAGNRQYPLMTLVQWWSSRIIQEAPHQRLADRWKPEKKQTYIRDLLTSNPGEEPCGAFATYQLIGGSPMFLNDGLQRTTTIVEFVNQPGLYGYSEDAVESVLQQEITIMHRHFKDHPQALESFQKLNNGTRLTSFELLRGILLYTDGYEHKWRPIIEKINKCIDGRWELFRSIKLKTEQEHMLYRHTLSVLYRYLSKESGLVAYGDVNKTDILIETLKERQRGVIESRLASMFLAMDQDVGYGEICRRADECCRWIEQTSGDLLLWKDNVLGPGAKLSPTLFRWIIDVSIWRKYNQLPVPLWEKFVCSLLQVSKGDSQFRIPKEDDPTTDRPFTLSLTVISPLSQLAVVFDLPDLIERAPRQRRVKRSIIGLDDGHLQPFRDNGNGPTAPQSRSVNRSMGAKPITP